MVGVVVGCVSSKGTVASVNSCAAGRVHRDHLSSKLVASDVQGYLCPAASIGGHVTVDLKWLDGAVDSVWIDGVCTTGFDTRGQQCFAT